ncbi:MAG TPA: 3-phosphoshikimate 1-carboxyvinyltransferase [Minicystis sp.]|nr:3-phosphoshikimate 1-carboxyvinyltransferase [Minicystis sp.]
MPDLVVHPAERPLVGSVPVPADKSITHRAVLLGGIARGRSRVVGGGGPLGEDNLATAAALRALGVGVEVDAAAGTVVLEGAGLDGLSAPDAAIDCGNSGTTMRLLAGVLAAQRFRCRLVGDASLSRRPMQRVVGPLRLRGARIEGRLDPARPGDVTAPLDVGPLPHGHVLSGIEHASPVASAQVKSAVLLSGLWADGATYVSEPHVSRDHTERMLTALGAPLRAVGAMVELEPSGWSRELPAFELAAPGDLSAAAFLLAAAHVVAGSRVDVRRVGLNPTRAGLLELLRDMGAAVDVEPKGDELGEPFGDVHAASAPLRGVRAGGEVVARAIDEIPALCAIAARAHGATEIADAAELRVKESDRIASMARVLRAFGVACEERPDGMAIEGRPEGKLRAADVESGGDHRVAMSAAVLALAADGPTRVRDAACIATSFPRFVGTLRALGARVDVEGEA